MLLALFLVAGATLVLCLLLFALAALALFVGVLAAQWADHSGAGLSGALLVGLAAGTATLFAGQSLLVSARSTSMRIAVVLLFVGPAAVAGFSAAHGLASFCVPSSVWQFLFGVGGAVCVALSAFARLTSVGAVPAEEPLKLAPMPERT